ncbi:hypothetical protein FGB62_32g129 [Gracilaria domingensis]|nr:hypothetical protein FGB62_32g129 [Gracilaria domingensis]
MIARMTEWNDIETWEYTEGEESSAENNLAAAKRFLAAQSFLLSWQEGKVPTRWRRPRKLTDFDGKYPRSVVDDAEDIIAERIVVKNMEKTIRLNAVLSARKSDSIEIDGNRDDAGQKKTELDALKADFAAFNTDFFEAKNCLTKATSSIAEISFRIQALSEVLK